MRIASGGQKRQYVQKMFERIALRYDLMNRLMTFGQDLRWRRVLVREANLPRAGRFLDVATGTGDVAFIAAEGTDQPDLIVGIDLVPKMVHLAHKRAKKRVCHREPVWMIGDTMCLPFASDTFDAVASAFLMRNVTDVVAALREQVRVTRPGGRVLILEVPRPDGRTFGNRLFRLYFHWIVPVLGWLITGDKNAYKYLPASAETFLTVGQLQSIMKSIGLGELYHYSFMFDSVAVHVAIKPHKGT